ncbi:hypothetical protein [Streptomyces collinus]|uniref:hypothetical protein n=1 Tax=Streptomyces collinus TaxID=42684 RepID=UPI0036AA6EA4
MEVDDQGGRAAGLYIRWSAPELAETAMQAVTERQDPTAPEWKHYSEVVLHMQTALIAILRLSGFTAVRAEEIDDVAEGDVYVRGDAVDGGDS